MEVTCKWQGDVLVAAVAGELDLRNQAVMEQEFQAIREHGAKAVVLDFSNVRFVSSLGIGLIMQLNRDLKSGGTGLQIAGVQPRIRLVFDMCNLGRVIPLAQSVEEACATCGAPGEETQPCMAAAS